MARGGPLRDRSSGCLLTAAALFDVLVLLVMSMLVVPIATELVPPGLLPGPIEARREIVAMFGTFLGLFPIFWILTELLLGGWSPGRALLRLELCDAEGQPLSRAKRAGRASRKLATLGLTGIHPARPGSYDQAVGAVWHSQMAPRKPRRVEAWTLTFLSGSIKGARSSLGRLPGLKERGVTRFGRDKKWADVALPADKGVSGQHAIMFRQEGKVFLRDGNGKSGSTHGTFVDGRRLGPEETVVLDDVGEIRLADVRIAIER